MCNNFYNCALLLVGDASQSKGKVTTGRWGGSESVTLSKGFSDISTYKGSGSAATKDWALQNED